MKNKYLYVIIGIQTLIMIACVVFALLKQVEENHHRIQSVEYRRQAELEKQKSVDLMLKCNELNQALEKCRQE